MSEDEEAALVEQIEADLKNLFGSPILTLDQLAVALNYKSVSALRQAITRNNFHVPLFTMPNRRGRFAMVKEVAKFLARQVIGGKSDEVK